MDPTRTVGTTEQTQDAGQMGGHLDRHMNGRTEWNQYNPKQFHCVEGIKMAFVNTTLVQAYSKLQ